MSINRTVIASAAEPTTDVPVDLDALICPECGEDAVPVPPRYWHVADGLLVVAFSYTDRSALCRTRAGVVAEPVEARRWPL